MQSVAAAQPSVGCANKTGGDTNSGGDEESELRSKVQGWRTRKARMTKLVPIFASLFLLAAPNSFATTVWPSDGTETGHNYSAGSVQWVHDNQAQNGDTITLFTGTFSYTTPLNITKGVTLQGNTQVIGAPMTWQTTVDNTIIVDDTLRTVSDLIHAATFTPTQSFRLTGITFKAGASTQTGAGNGAIHFGDQYQIHRLLTQLDQNGRGKGDLVRVVNGLSTN